MPLTPEDVRTKEFRNTFRGYNEPEVDAFLDEVEAELTRLLRENSELKDRIATASTAAISVPAAAPMGETEEMLRRTLLIAQRTADETVAQAKADADRIVADAQAHTQQLVSQAHQQANAHIGDLDARRRALEQHIEGLRAFEREYRTRLKAYLEAQLRDLDGRPGPAAQPAVPTVPPLPAIPAAYDEQATPLFSGPPAIPSVEPTPSSPPPSQTTDIPGGFVRRHERHEGDGSSGP
jgi:DivIVA domain-containing protein